MRVPLRVIRRAAAAVLLLLPALPALPAAAGQITVEFDLTGSSVSILGGFIDVPPDGSITAGSGDVRVAGAGSATPSGGPAGISNLSLAGTFARSGLGVNVAGAVGASQAGPANGTLSGGLGHLSFAPFVMDFTGFASCSNTGTAPGCAVLGLPTTFTGPKIFSLASLGVGNLASIGAATLNGTFSFTLGGFTAVLNLVGNEVSRTYVPEPGTFGLLGLGLAGLAVLRARRRA